MFTGQRLLLVNLSRKIWYRIFTCEHEHGKQEKRTLVGKAETKKEKRPNIFTCEDKSEVGGG